MAPTEYCTLSIVPLKQVNDLWNKNDVLIFIADLKDYSVLDEEYLDKVEKIYLNSLKTEYFRKRYIISRLLLKYLSGILKERPWSDMVTCKDEHGRVRVRDHNDLHVCIAYTENIVALAISKIEMGIDIEVIRSRSVASISRSIDRTLSDSTPSRDSFDFLARWTLKEAYCKFSNETMFSSLARKLDLSDVSHSSYVLDSKYILAFVTKFYPYKIKIVRLQRIDLDKEFHY